MSARPSDPIAALREAASLLPIGARGRATLAALADRTAFGHDFSGHSLTDLLADVEAMTAHYTPDERAAFALAREALSTLDAAAKETL